MRVQAAAVFLGALALPAFAAGPNFNYATASYVQSDSTDSAGNDVSGDGFGLELSYQLANTYWGMQPLGMIDYSKRTFDAGGVSSDMGLYSVGAGVTVALTDIVSVFGGLTYEALEADAPQTTGAAAKVCQLGVGPLCLIDDGQPEDTGDTGTDTGSSRSSSLDGSDSGIGAKVGVKGLFYNMFETTATYSYRDYDFDTESVIGVGAAVLWRQFAFTLNYDTYDKLNMDDIRVGARYDF